MNVKRFNTKKSKAKNQIDFRTYPPPVLMERVWDLLLVPVVDTPTKNLFASFQLPVKG